MLGLEKLVYDYEYGNEGLVHVPVGTVLTGIFHPEIFVYYRSSRIRWCYRVCVSRKRP